VTSICPRCGQPKLHHSRARGAFERFRRHFTDRVPFRCHGCGWRGWLHDIVAESPPRDVMRSLSEADYERIDVKGEAAPGVEIRPAETLGLDSRLADQPGLENARKDDRP